MNKQKFKDFLAHLGKHKVQTVSVVVFIIPILVSCIILFPREHYIYLMMIPLIYIGCIIYSVRFGFTKLPVLEYLIFLIVLILLVASTPSTNTYFKDQPSLSNLKTAKFISSLNINKEVVLLENEGGIDVFLKENYRVLIGVAKNDTFNHFMEQSNINMIWVTDKLAYDARYNGDKEWHYFIANYQQWHFKRVDIPECNSYLLIKYEL